MIEIEKCFYFRANNARSKAHSAEIYAKQARHDSVDARASAKLAAPDFRQPGLFSSKTNISFPLLFSLLGEEKPQPFITLDIDRQVDGKFITSNHINVSPPNGRLPISLNYPPNNLTPLPSHLSQPHPSTVTSLSPFALDGGVYQGHPPTQLTPKVNFRNLLFIKKNQFRLLDHHLP